MSDEPPPGPAKQKFLAALTKGLAFISTCIDQQKTVTVSDAASLTNVSRATARSIFNGEALKNGSY